jgi:hypothetical protein
MFVSADQIQNGVINFVEQEIAAKATGVTKFATYMVMPRIHKMVESYVTSFAENPITKDLFDENRYVNIDEIYEMAKTAMRKAGQITFSGIIFNENDIEKLYAHIVGR